MKNDKLLNNYRANLIMQIIKSNKLYDNKSIDEIVFLIRKNHDLSESEEILLRDKLTNKINFNIF